MGVSSGGSVCAFLSRVAGAHVSLRPAGLTRALGGLFLGLNQNNRCILNKNFLPVFSKPAGFVVGLRAGALKHAANRVGKQRGPRL